MNAILKNQKELLKLFDNMGNTLTNHLLNSTNRTTWFGRTPRTPKRGEYWTGIYPFKVDAEDTTIFPHIVLYLLEEESDILLAVNIEFKRPLLLLNSKASNELVDKIKAVKGGEVCVRKKLSNNKWLSEAWDDNLSSIPTENIDLSILRTILSQISIYKKSTNNQYEFKPVFLIQYKLNKNSLLNFDSLTELLKEKITMLAPIVEYLSI